MNKFPYPVLTEIDSAYKENNIFKIEFLEYKYQNNLVKLDFDLILNSENIVKFIEEEKAEIIVKVKSSITSITERISKFSKNFSVEIKPENIKSNDILKIVAYVVAKCPFELTYSKEMNELFGEDYSVFLRKNDPLAISNEETLNYNTTSNDFIKIVSSPEREDNGITIKLRENYIEIQTGLTFKVSYGKLKKPEISPILNSHMIFEALVFALVSVTQRYEEYSDKEWCRLLMQALTSTGESEEEFLKKSKDDNILDMEYIFDVAQTMIGNSLETSIINVSKLCEKKGDNK